MILTTTHVERLGAFAANASFDQLSEAAIEALKLRVLDSLGTALGALDAEPVALVRRQVEDFGGAPHCSLIGGGRSAPDRAALLNGALVRYLDFNDAYLAPGETCHPSDNVAPVLAACEYAGGGGRDLLTALAVAYQVQCRLSDVAPVRAHGFDHVTRGAYAVAAGVSRALGLDPVRAANAIAIAGTSLNALRVTRTGELSHWKGLAYPATAFGATHAAFLAARGITGPREVFEGNKGFMDAIAGRFELDWEREDLEAVTRTILKRFNAEIHSQSAIEALLELRAEHGLGGGDVERIELDVFEVAYDIIGGGEEGDKTAVETKEQADHSLPYLLAVALIDGQVMPAQYEAARIVREDVQRLLRRVEVRPDAELSLRFPAEHACRLRIRLHDGRLLERSKRDYEGFHTRRWAGRQSWQSSSASAPRSPMSGCAGGPLTRWRDSSRSTSTSKSSPFRSSERDGHQPRRRGRDDPARHPHTRAAGVPFLTSAQRPGKPRTRGVTEIRGPYYSVMGPRYLEDVLDTMGEHVDALKFAGGSFTLMPERALAEFIATAHAHDVLVSTGGFIERVLTQGPVATDRYIEEAARLGFDILEISAGFIAIPTDDILRLVERVQRAGMKAKPEVGIQFGAGGATTPAELEQEGTRDVGYAIDLARRCLDAGAYMIMIESEGITEEVTTWRTDVVATIARELGLEQVMFEAADPEVFGWYVKNYGPEVNLFVDHSQIVQLECVRRGIWGTKSLWGRVVTYPGD